MHSTIQWSIARYILILASILYSLFFYNILGATGADSLSYPNLTGRVIDDANILNPQTIEEITALSKTLGQQESIQLVVVVLKNLQGRSIEDYGISLARHWKIGQKDTNNGILLILAPNEREVRIEVGYGVEGDLTDALSKQIIEKTMIPFLKENNPNQALLKGTEAIVQLFVDPKEFKKHMASDPLPLGDIIISSIVLIGFFLVLFIRARSRKNRVNGFWGGGFRGGRGSGDSGGFRGGGGSFGGGGASGRF